MKIFTVFVLTLLTTSSVFAGGISGGGGGTIIPDPAGTEFIVRQLSGARTSLLMFLKNLSYESSRTSLFQGSNNILEKVKQYALHIETDKPCYDFDGKPNDGSINSVPGTICLSAKTIGEKVSMVTAYPQLLALMAHEYSHLMGYDEKEATAFQTEVLYLTKSVSETEGFSLGTQFISEANLAMFKLNYAQSQHMLGKDPKRAYEPIKRADDAVLFPYKYPFRALDRIEATQVGEIAIRLKNLRLYACSLYEAEENEKEMCEYQYKNIFMGADEIKATDFSMAYYGNTDLQPSGMVPNLIQNPGKYIGEIQALQEELRSMTEVIGEQLNLRD